jgi:hypothetical protein
MTLDPHASTNAGQRPLRARWLGPFAYRDGIYRVSAGLYLVMAGQNLLYVGGAPNVSAALNRHVMFTERGVTPHDMVGRELLHYAQRYSERLSLKVAEVFDADGALITDQDTLDDAVSLLIYAMHPPCNPHGRAAFEGYQALSIAHTGKHFPLPPRTAAIPTHGRPRPAPTPPPAAPSSPEPPADAASRPRPSLRESFD